MFGLHTLAPADLMWLPGHGPLLVLTNGGFRPTLSTSARFSGLRTVVPGATQFGNALALYRTRLHRTINPIILNQPRSIGSCSTILTTTFSLKHCEMAK
jgi:hypothetical protein